MILFPQNQTHSKTTSSLAPFHTRIHTKQLSIQDAEKTKSQWYLKDRHQNDPNTCCIHDNTVAD
jgi:hypothetical protein